MPAWAERKRRRGVRIVGGFAGGCFSSILLVLGSTLDTIGGQWWWVEVRDGVVERDRLLFIGALRGQELRLIVI